MLSVSAHHHHHNYPQQEHVGTTFKSGLSERLIEISVYATQEMEKVHQEMDRASRELAALRSENQSLKSQLLKRPAVSLDLDSVHMQTKDAEGQQNDGLRDLARPDDPSHSPDKEFNFEKMDSGGGRSADDGHSKNPMKKLSKSGSSLERRGSFNQLHLHLPNDGVAPRRPSKMMYRKRLRSSSSFLELEGPRIKRIVQSIAHHYLFENATLILTLFNALWLGLDADLNGRPLLDSPPAFQAVEHVFTAVFTFELIIRLGAAEKLRKTLTDKWILVDLVLVPMMVVDTWILTILFLFSGIKDIKGLGFMSILRILRVMRIARMGRICRVVPELETMVKSMVAGVRAVCTTTMLLLAMTYGCAILMRQLSGSSSWGDENFKTVPGSIYTLLIHSMLPDNGDMLTLLLKERWYCGVIYFTFLLFSTIMVVNMLVALLCDVVANTSRMEQNQRSIDSMGRKLHEILKSIDNDFDGFVSREEFEKIIENMEAVTLFQNLGVDVDALVDEADFIFDKKQRKQLSFDDFKEEVLQFRQTSYATMGTITATRRMIRLSLEQIAAKIVRLETMVQKTASLQCASASLQCKSCNSGCKEGLQYAGQLPAQLAAALPASECTKYSDLLHGMSKLWHGASSKPRCSPLL